MKQRLLSLLLACMLSLGAGGGAAAQTKESLTYLYAGTTASYLKILSHTGRALTTVCTDYFDIKADGSLWITPPNKIDPEFIREMHARDILVTPFISNHWDRAVGLSALANRAALTVQIADVIEQYDLDGVNVDIENVTEQSREAYTDFVRLLRAKLPAHKLVTVAVAANPYNWTSGWQGSYDYKALSDHSDYLMLMTYDESYQGGPAGPVSSKLFFERSIQYAINQGVPKHKIVAGLPFFGRYWKNGSGGIGLAASDIEYLLGNYPSSTRYDKDTESANATVTIRPGDPKPIIWGGRTMPEGTYDIWYDSLSSVKFKLDTIHALGIRGAGSWALGQENPDMWTFYTTALYGGAAPPSKNERLVRVLDALNRPSGGSKNPRAVASSTVLTRGEMAVVLAEMTYVEPETGGENFSDTANYWGAGHIRALKRRGLISGTGGGLFHPDRNLTREEAIAMVERVLVLPNTIDHHLMTFKDVTPSMWSYAPIAKLNYFSIVAGVSRDYFKPFDPISAASMALLFDKVEPYPMNPDKFVPVPSGTIPDDPIINPR